MGNYAGANWSPAYMDDCDSTMYGSQRTGSNLDANSDEEGSVIVSVIGSVVTGLTSNTVLQPNFIRDESIITAIHGNDNTRTTININKPKISENKSVSQSEFEYLQSVFPHINKKEDVLALYTHSDISTNTTSTQQHINMLNSNNTLIKKQLNKKLITGMPPQHENNMYASSSINSLNHIDNIDNKNNNNNNNNNRKIITYDEYDENTNHNTDLNNNIENDNIYNEKDIIALNNIDKPKKRKKKRKKRRDIENEYQTLASPHTLTSHSRYSSYDDEKHNDNNKDNNGNNGCFCDFLNTLFYMIIAILSVCLIFGSLFVDICMVVYVYWPHETPPLTTHINIYFIPSLICISLTLISYFLNSCCFFIHTDYCDCAPSYIAPLLRCFMSLPPFGVIYTLMLIPGVHSLPFHMASALCQYLLNLMYMMTNTNDIIKWNWIQLGVGSAHLILSPMFAWLQQSNQGNLTVFRCLQLMTLWLCSISPLTILELINIFPVFIEYFSNKNHQLDIRTFITLICWSILIRLIFAFIFVDEDGSRLSLICFKPLRVYDNNNNNSNQITMKAKKKKRKKSNKKPTCYICLLLFRAIGQLILQIFYLALPLLPTAAATVRLYKKQCIEYAKWNHLCIAVYLVFTYLPMLYLLLGNNNPAPYTWVTISIAYLLCFWVVMFLPRYLRSWVNFKW